MHLSIHNLESRDMQSTEPRLAYRWAKSLTKRRLRGFRTGDQSPPGTRIVAQSQSVTPRPGSKGQFLCCDTRPPAGISYESRVSRPHNRKPSSRRNEEPGSPGGDMMSRLSGPFDDNKQDISWDTREREIERRRRTSLRSVGIKDKWPLKLRREREQLVGTVRAKIRGAGPTEDNPTQTGDRSSARDKR